MRGTAIPIVCQLGRRRGSGHFEKHEFRFNAGNRVCIKRRKTILQESHMEAPDDSSRQSDTLSEEQACEPFDYQGNTVVAGGFAF